MLKTALGNIIITINEKKYNYDSVKLTNESKNFTVDGRYLITLNNTNISQQDTLIDCILDSNNSYLSFPESGEGLALISFICKNIKLSIGVEGDLPGVYYEYMYDRLRVKITGSVFLNKLNFLIAWLTMHNKKEEEIYTWFAADPTLLT